MFYVKLKLHKAMLKIFFKKPLRTISSGFDVTSSKQSTDQLITVSV